VRITFFSLFYCSVAIAVQWQFIFVSEPRTSVNLATTTSSELPVCLKMSYRIAQLDPKQGSLKGKNAPFTYSTLQLEKNSLLAVAFVETPIPFELSV